MMDNSRPYFLFLAEEICNLEVLTNIYFLLDVPYLEAAGLIRAIKTVVYALTQYNKIYSENQCDTP